MDIFTAVILGFLQGVMEFLPISSKGHLILANEILPIEGVDKLALMIAFYLSTALAMILYFWNDIWVLIQTLMRKMGKLPVNDKDLILLYSLAVATIPAIFIGLVLESVIDKYLANVLMVAVMLIISASLLIYAEWKYYTNPPSGEINIKKGFKIGLFQVLSLIPGFSRTGATVAGGMLLGLSRYESTRFSFLLAIPIILGLGIKNFLDLIVENGEVVWLPVIIGSIVSFIVALITVHLFLVFIRKYTLWPFIWYSIILSLLTFYYLFFVQ